MLGNGSATNCTSFYIDYLIYSVSGLSASAQTTSFSSSLLKPRLWLWPKGAKKQPTNSQKSQKKPQILLKSCKDNFTNLFQLFFRISKRAHRNSAASRFQHYDFTIFFNLFSKLSCSETEVLNQLPDIFSLGIIGLSPNNIVLLIILVETQAGSWNPG